jgi:hypothetical protein
LRREPVDVTPDHGTEALLRELVAEVRGLRALIEASRPTSRRTSLCAADAPRLQHLLLAANDACGDAIWPATELVALGLVNADLARALEAHLPKSGNGGLRRLGRFLSRCAGHGVEGLCLLRVGEDRCGALWQVKRV